MLPSSLAMSTSAAAATAAAAAKPLSCANCRQRKIKCDRNPPRCTQCARSDLDCLFPSRKRTQRPRRMRHNELLNRISRLESIVGRADANIGDLGRDTFERVQASAGAAAAGAALGAASSGPGAAGAAGAGAASGSGGAASSPANQGKASFIGTAAQGSGAVGGPTARFMSGEFWSNLCDEVEGLKAALEQSSDSESDDDDPAGDDTPESSGPGAPPRDLRRTPVSSSGLVLGNPGYDGEEPDAHPPPDQIMKLIETFLTNVDPLMKILHRPTVIAAMGGFVAGGLAPGSLSAPMDALFFAMYFGAVATSPPRLCVPTFGEEKAPLTDRYRFAAEKALAKADYLNSTDLTTLQAFTIYVVGSCFCPQGLGRRFHANLHRTGRSPLMQRQPTIVGTNKPRRAPRPGAQPAPRRRWQPV